MAKVISVQKLLKVNGKRQTWGVFELREGVSARVWDRSTVAPGEYFMAAYARSVAEQVYDVGGLMWQRNQGRGSAYYVRPLAVAKPDLRLEHIAFGGAAFSPLSPAGAVWCNRRVLEASQAGSSLFVAGDGCMTGFDPGAFGVEPHSVADMIELALDAGLTFDTDKGPMGREDITALDVLKGSN